MVEERGGVPGGVDRAPRNAEELAANETMFGEIKLLQKSIQPVLLTAPNLFPTEAILADHYRIAEYSRKRFN